MGRAEEYNIASPQRDIEMADQKKANAENAAVDTILNEIAKIADDTPTVIFVKNADTKRASAYGFPHPTKVEFCENDIDTARVLKEDGIQDITIAGRSAPLDKNTRVWVIGPASPVAKALVTTKQRFELFVEIH